MLQQMGRLGKKNKKLLDQDRLMLKPTRLRFRGTDVWTRDAQWTQRHQVGIYHDLNLEKDETVNYEQKEETDGKEKETDNKDEENYQKERTDEKDRG